MFIWGLTRGRVKYRKRIHTIVDTVVKLYFTCLDFSLYADIPYDKPKRFDTFPTTKVLQNMNFIEYLFKLQTNV